VVISIREEEEVGASRAFSYAMVPDVRRTRGSAAGAAPGRLPVRGAVAQQYAKEETMRRVSIALVLAAASLAWGANVYTNEADFLAAIGGGGGYLLEDFNGYTYGSYQELTLQLGPMNGYAGLISAQGGANSVLWSGDGNMSTGSALDGLHVEFNGDSTYSTAGWFFPSDYDGYYTPGAGMVIDLSDGTHYVYYPLDDHTFLGFVSTVPLLWIQIEAPDVVEPLAYYWPTMDHFYCDSPEPGSLLLLGLAGLMIRRR
jgi:hypothetical protein